MHIFFYVIRLHDSIIDTAMLYQTMVARNKQYNVNV